MPFIIPANTLAAAGGFSVDNSCRFNGDAYLHRTPSATGNPKKWTYSVWVKMAQENPGYFLAAGSGTQSKFIFGAYGGGDIDILTYEGYVVLANTARLFRDPLAWYNIILAVDTTQGTNTNGIKLWVNGVQQTLSFNSVGSENGYTQNTSLRVGTNNEPIHIGRDINDSGHWKGYMAECALVNDAQLDADQFGEFDEDSGIWKPIDISGLTFGTNGFHLDFKDSSAFGNDVSGNNNDFTVVGLAAADQSVDTCTNNQCVLNSILLPNSQPATFSQGNTQIAQNGNWRSYAGTFGLTSGKWYFEADGSGTAGTVLYGIASLEAIQLQNSGSSNLNYTIGLNKPAYAYHGSSGGMYHSTSSANAQGQGGGSWGAAFNSSNLISVYIDLDNNKLYTAKDNTMNVSGTGYDIEAGFTYFPVVIGYAVTTALNFGNGDFNGTAVSSAVADANGFGKFEFDPSRGGGSDFDGAAKDFLCINSKNLSTVNS